jgi:hypothetical protein
MYLASPMIASAGHQEDGIAKQLQPNSAPRQAKWPSFMP